MNNFDKIIQQKLRAKYFRAPKVDEIKLELRDTWRGFTLFILIGKEYRRRVSLQHLLNKVREDFVKRTVSDFNNFKADYKLRKICELCDIEYNKLFEPKIKSYLLNKEGIEFAKKLMFKLMKQKQTLLQVTQNLNEMQAEIRVFDNRARRIYNKSTNVLVGDLQWIISFLKIVLNTNGVL